MSQQSGIFDSTYVVETAEGFPRGDKAVDAAFLARSKKLYFKNGVFPNPSSNFQVLAHQGMTVQVRPGSCFLNGYEAWDDEMEYMLAPVSSQAQSVFVAQRMTLNPPESAKIEKALIIGDVSTKPTRNSDIYEIFLARNDDRSSTGDIHSVRGVRHLSGGMQFAQEQQTRRQKRSGAADDSHRETGKHRRRSDGN